MCNECPVIECITVYVSPCDTGIDTTIVLPDTGDYTVLVEFNGITKTMTVEGVADANLILPNIFMPPYIHHVQVLDPAGELLNDTCYSFNAKLALGIGNELNPNPPVGARKIITVDVDGDSFTNSFFADHTIVEIVTDGQAYVVGAAFTQSGSTITWINGNRFYDGQIILAQA